MKHLNLLSLIYTILPLKAQNKSTPEHYDYPLESYYQPLEVQSNIILLYRKDGSGNFDLNIEEEKSLLYDFLERVNYIFSHFEKPKDLSHCYKGNDLDENFLNDAKIRIKSNIVQVKNEFSWNYLNSGAQPEKKIFSGFSPTQNWYIKPLNDSISSAKDIPKGINVYFTTNGEEFDKIVQTKAKNYDLSGAAASQFPTDRNLKQSSQLNLPNRYLKYILHKYKAPIEYKTTWEETRGWHLNDARGFAHEYGHSFGLSHSSEHYKTNMCDYTLMSQRGSASRNWLPPSEIKKMHWNLTRTNLMQFVTPESAYEATWYLKENTEWNKPRRFYHNFELAKGISLIISEPIILPPNSYVKLNKNAKLIFQGNGKIVDAYGKAFINFQKHRTAKIITKN